MKRLLYLLLLLPLSVFGAGSIAQDGKNFDQSDGTSIAVTAGGAITSGNFIHVFVTNEADITPTVSDDLGNTYTEIDSFFTGSDQTVSHFYAEVTMTGTPTITASFSSTGYRGIMFKEIAGVSAFDDGTGQEQTMPGTSTDAVTSGAITVSGTGFISGFSQAAGARYPAAGTSFTEDDVGLAFNGTDRVISESQAGVTTSAAATFTAQSDVPHFSLGAVFTETAASPATLSSPTPSGTLGTSTTATLGATTDVSSGTFYGVVDTAGNISGITAAQVKAGNNNGDSAAVAACNDTVSDTSPSCGVTGLTANTGYSYAVVQNSAGGDSNVATGTFTTAMAGGGTTSVIYQTMRNQKR